MKNLKPNAGYLRLLLVALAAALLYVLASALLFHMPANAADGEACGFTPEDFQANGQLAMDHWAAWWLSFRRQQDYFSAISLGAAAAFVAHALAIGRRAGAARSAGAAAGGGLLALSALCVSCLAPVMSAVGLGLAAGWLAGIPKWLIAVNSIIYTLWGGLVLARRGAACPLPSTPSTPARPASPGSNASSACQGQAL